MQNLIRYSEPRENTKTLFVWPEGVFSGYNFNELRRLKKLFKNSFNENHLILFGVNRIDLKKRELTIV